MTTALPTAGSRAVTYAWLALSAITVLSWWLAPGPGGGDATASIPITLAVVLLGFIKGRLVIRHFMEVRTAPQWLKMATDAWLTVLWLAILAVYLF